MRSRFNTLSYLSYRFIFLFYFYGGVEHILNGGGSGVVISRDSARVMAALVATAVTGDNTSAMSNLWPGPAPGSVLSGLGTDGRRGSVHDDARSPAGPVKERKELHLEERRVDGPGGGQAGTRQRHQRHQRPWVDLDRTASLRPRSSTSRGSTGRTRGNNRLTTLGWTTVLKLH